MFPGVRLRYFWGSHGIALSPVVIDVQAIQLFPYQPTLADTFWIPNFSSCRFSPRLCVPLGFLLISGKGDEFEGLWELPSALYEGNLLHRETTHWVFVQGFVSAFL